jgi:hypothetical protein
MFFFWRNSRWDTLLYHIIEREWFFLSEGVRKRLTDKGTTWADKLISKAIIFLSTTWGRWNKKRTLSNYLKFIPTQMYVHMYWHLYIHKHIHKPWVDPRGEGSTRGSTLLCIFLTNKYKLKHLGDTYTYHNTYVLYTCITKYRCFTYVCTGVCTYVYTDVAP